MIRHIILGTLLCALSSVSVAQEYYVLGLKSIMPHPKRSAYLKAGDTLNNKHSIRFEDRSKRIAVLNGTGPHMMIQPGPISKKPGHTDEWKFDSVKFTVKPGNRKTLLASPRFTNAEDFRAYFKRDTLLMLPVMKFAIDLARYPQSETEFFTFMDNEMNFGKTTSKLRASGDTLLIEWTQLFSEEQLKLLSDYGKLKIYDGAFPVQVAQRILVYVHGDLYDLIGKISYRVPDKKMLYDGIRTLKRVYVGRTEQEIRDEAASFMIDVYGKLDKANFDAWYLTVDKQ